MPGDRIEDDNDEYESNSANIWTPTMGTPYYGDEGWYGVMPWDLGGETARQDRARLDHLAEQREGLWRTLARGAPSVDALTPNYAVEGTSDAYGDLLGDPSTHTGDMEGVEAQRAALAGLADITDSGGYTRADQDMSRAMRARQAMAMRGANEASLQQMQARGMGGSGAEMAARLGASQNMAGNNSMADAQIQQGAMQRALQSMQMQGSIGGHMDSNEMQRRNALDAFNQQNLGWRRGAETRNTQAYNRQQDRGADAAQQAYQNQERAVAGYDQQYGTEVGARQNQDTGSEGTEELISMIGAAAVAACCHPETPIATPEGDRPISELREGDLVLSVHQGRVEAVQVKATQKVAVGADHITQRVHLSTGAVLHITPNHPTARGYGIGELVAGDYLGGVRIAATEAAPYGLPATHDILPDSDTGTYFTAGAHLGSTMGRG